MYTTSSSRVIGDLIRSYSAEIGTSFLSRAVSGAVSYTSDMFACQSSVWLIPYLLRLEGRWPGPFVSLLDTKCLCVASNMYILILIIKLWAIIYADACIFDESITQEQLIF